MYLRSMFDEVCVIVLNCGFTLYNLALDCKGRYGRTGTTSKVARDKSLRCYRALVNEVTTAFAIQQKPTYLNTLADLIEVATYTSTGKMTLAKDMLLKRNCDDDPDLLAALFSYHAALVDISFSHLPAAKDCLKQAYKVLKCYIFKYSSLTAYSYNVIHGK